MFSWFLKVFTVLNANKNYIVVKKNNCWYFSTDVNFFRKGIENLKNTKFKNIELLKYPQKI